MYVAERGDAVYAQLDSGTMFVVYKCFVGYFAVSWTWTSLSFKNMSSLDKCDWAGVVNEDCASMTQPERANFVSRTKSSVKPSPRRSGKS